VGNLFSYRNSIGLVGNLFSYSKFVAISSEAGYLCKGDSVTEWPATESCSVLHCVVMCCSVLQTATFARVIALSSGLQQRVAMYCIVMQCVAVLLCVANCYVCKGDSLIYWPATESCSVLHCVAMCCSVLQIVTFPRVIALSSDLQQKVAVYCIVLQCVAELLCVAECYVSKSDSLIQ